MRLPITIDQSHELVELDQLLSLNGKSWRVVQIEPGPSHFGYRVATGTGLRAAVERITTRSQRPANRGEVIEHVIDEGHTPNEPCDFCAALSSEASVVPLRVTVWLEEA